MCSHIWCISYNKTRPGNKEIKNSRQTKNLFLSNFNLEINGLD